MSASLVQQNAELLAEIKGLLARIAELEARLDQPPKTPDNSSLPPSRGQKANAGPPAIKPPRKSRPGVARKLAETPDETRRFYAERCACGAVLGEAGQELARESTIISTFRRSGRSRRASGCSAPPAPAARRA